jgi:hypothetical protein
VSGARGRRAHCKIRLTCLNSLETPGSSLSMRWPRRGLARVCFCPGAWQFFDDEHTTLSHRQITREGHCKGIVEIIPELP